MLLICAEIISSVGAGWLISNFNSFFVCKIRKDFEKIRNRIFFAYWLMYGKKIGTSPCKLFFSSLHFDLDFSLRACLKPASHL
jgi:hypothetical protein